MTRYLRACRHIRPFSGAYLGLLLLINAVSALLRPPLIRLLLAAAIRAAGMRYLTQSNLGRFLRSPLVWPVLLVLALALVLPELFEMICLVCIAECHIQHRRPLVSEIVRMGLVILDRAFAQKDWRILLQAICLLPMIHLRSALYAILSHTALSSALRQALRHWYGAAAAAAICLLLVYLMRRFGYAIHLYVLEGRSGKEADEAGRELARDPEAGVMALETLAVQIFLFVIYLAVLVAAVAAALLISRVTGINGAGPEVVLSTVLKLLSRLGGMLSMPAVMIGITGHFYEQRLGREEAFARHVLRMEEVPAPQRRGEARAVRIAIAVLAAAYVWSSSYDTYSLRIEHMRTVQVTAHRGASTVCPENTMAAFEEAIRQGADWIELDVRESRDGRVIVLHDESLKRTTGADSKAWELDYGEMAALDAGSGFSEAFAGERIPLLSEVIALAREEGIGLNIEIKADDHTPLLTEHVIALLQEADFLDECVITSQTYEVLRTAKEISGDVHTVYVMGFAYGAVNRLSAADGFSIRASVLSQSLVTDLHNRGIEVYAWTVDARSSITRMISLGVDHIITNNVPLARECIHSGMAGGLVQSVRRTLQELFA